MKSFEEFQHDEAFFENPADPAKLKELGLPVPPRPAILLYDVENAPILGWSWETYDTNLIATEQDWYMLSFAFKWYGQGRVHFVGLNQEDREPDDPNDYHVIERLYALFDAADAIVAHNNDRFDRRKANARFAYHGFTPPAPYVNIDTLKVARKHFMNSSNKLNDLAHLYGFGEKTPHTGWRIWRGCMRGDKKAWKTMEKYNKQDVVLLEDLYERLLPWIDNHLNLQQFADPLKFVCPKCGHDDLVRRGKVRTKVNEFQVWKCRECGGNSRTRLRSNSELPLRIPI